jgi:cellobiose-specific phosphotransferase system component IIB
MFINRKLHKGISYNFGNKNEVVPKINVPVKSINKVSYVPITNAQQNWSPNLS